VTVPELRHLLKDRYAIIRAAAANALGKIGPDARDAVPVLHELLKDSDSLLRRFAAEALGNIGPDAEEVVPDLIAALVDKEHELYLVAVVALRKIGKAAVPYLLTTLAGSDPVLRAEVAEVLGSLASDASQAVPALVNALQDPDPAVAVAAVHALGKIAPGLASTNETRYLGDLDRALELLPTLRDRIPSAALDETIASVTQARKALRWNKWFWWALLPAVAVVGIAIAVPLLYFRTSVVYRFRAWFGARWWVNFDPTVWQVRIASDDKHTLIQVTPGASAVATCERRIPLTAEHKEELRAARLKPLPSGDYLDLLRRTLGWDIGIEQMLGRPDSPIELVVDAAWQAEMFETLPVGAEALGLTNPLCRLAVTQTPVGPPVTESFELRGLVIGDPETDLKKAAREATIVHGVFSGAGIRSTLLLGKAATLGEINRVLSGPGHWLLHYAGHVRSTSAWQGWEVALHGGAMAATDFVTTVSHGRTILLAFMNGCNSVGDLEDLGAPGLGALFLQQGVPFVGTQMPVYDQTALKFATVFYNAFLPERNTVRGETLGGAVLRARRRLRSASWVDYFAFGRPGYHLRFEARR
jgi:hypothetical protein